MKKGSFKWNSE